MLEGVARRRTAGRIAGNDDEVDGRRVRKGFEVRYLTGAQSTSLLVLTTLNI